MAAAKTRAAPRRGQIRAEIIVRAVSCSSYGLKKAMKQVTSSSGSVTVLQTNELHSLPGPLLNQLDGALTARV